LVYLVFSQNKKEKKIKKFFFLFKLEFYKVQFIKNKYESNNYYLLFSFFFIYLEVLKLNIYIKSVHIDIQYIILYIIKLIKKRNN